jgi:hypothetical protein
MPFRWMRSLIVPQRGHGDYPSAEEKDEAAAFGDYPSAEENVEAAAFFGDCRHTSTATLRYY